MAITHSPPTSRGATRPLTRALNMTAPRKRRRREKGTAGSLAALPRERERGGTADGTEALKSNKCAVSKESVTPWVVGGVLKRVPQLLTSQTIPTMIGYHL